jgi:sugar phosphate isomerase/epimerase
MPDPQQQPRSRRFAQRLALHHARMLETKPFAETLCIARDTANFAAGDAAADGSAHAGAGSVRWQEVFALLAEKSYQGYLGYEAPNPLLWAGPAMDAARDDANATRVFLKM